MCSIVTGLHVVLRVVLCTLLCTELCPELCATLCTELCAALRTAVYYIVDCVQYAALHCVPHCFPCSKMAARAGPRWIILKLAKTPGAYPCENLGFDLYVYTANAPGEYLNESVNRLVGGFRAWPYINKYLNKSSEFPYFWAPCKASK